MKKISYIDTISYAGIRVKNIGRVHQPLLKDIFNIGYSQYQYGLTLFMYTPEKFLQQFSEITGSKNVWDSMTNEEKNQITMFDILTINQNRFDLQQILEIFVDGKLSWDDKNNRFLINAVKTEDGKLEVDGYIDRDNYTGLILLCCELVGIDAVPVETEISTPKFATEKDRQFYEMYMKRKKEKHMTKKSDPRFELENMISVVCTYHSSINYTNVFNLTIMQLYDTFRRLTMKQQLSIHDMNYAVWGGKQYDPQLWLDRMDKTEKDDNQGGL